MSELNELFEQILHSERSFKARICRLKKLSSQIQQNQSELQQVKDEVHTHLGEVAVKNSKLADVEVTCRLLTVRRDILQEQRDKLAESKAELSAELGTANIQLESLRQSLVDDLLEFNQSYDLHGSGYTYREEQARRRIGILQEEMMLLEAELTDMDCQKKEVEKFEAELTAAKAAAEKERDRMKELKNTLERVDAEVKQLENDRKEFSQKSSTNPEFGRLQKELRSCKECHEEALCQSLTKELEELERQCYHKQMKQQLSLQGGQGRNTSQSATGRDTPSRNEAISRRPGHYNPYTHQYVPAPSSTSNGSDHGIPTKRSSAGRVQQAQQSIGKQHLTAANYISSQTPSRVDSIGSFLGGDSQSLGSPDSDKPMNIIGDDWLMVDDDESCHDEGKEEEEDERGDSDWMMELDDSELASLGDELESLSHSPTGALDSVGTPTRSGHQKGMKRGPGRQLSNRWYNTPTSTYSLHSSSMSAVTAGNRKSASAMFQDRTHWQTSGQFSNSTDSVRSTRERASGDLTHTRRWQQSIQSHDSLLVLDSPDIVRRRRPGQSIYKAPGQDQQSKPSLPKTAKKVRFNY